MKTTEKVDAFGMLEQQLTEAPKELVAKLEAALGARGKPAILELVKRDPEARRIFLKIVGTASPLGAEASLNPPAPDEQFAQRMYGRKKPNITF